MVIPRVEVIQVHIIIILTWSPLESKVRTHQIDVRIAFQCRLLHHAIVARAVLAQRTRLVQVPSLWAPSVWRAILQSNEACIMRDAVFPCRYPGRQGLGLGSPIAGRDVTTVDDLAYVPPNPTRVPLLDMEEHIIHVLLVLGMIRPPIASRADLYTIVEQMYTGHHPHLFALEIVQGCVGEARTVGDQKDSTAHHASILAIQSIPPPAELRHFRVL